MARKLPVFLRNDEPEKLLRATWRERDRILFMCLLYLGLRVSEVCRLDVADVDFQRGEVWVREGKGKKDRVLPIPRRFAGPLRGWIGSRAEGPVFPSRKGGGRLKSRGLQQLIKRLAERAGLKDALEPRRVTPHKLRHSFATRMNDRGADLFAIKDALGHASISTTQVYVHCSPEHIRKAMEI